MLCRAFLSIYTIDINRQCGTYQKVAGSTDEPGSEEYNVGSRCLWSGLIHSDRLGVHPSLSQCHVHGTDGTYVDQRPAGVNRNATTTGMEEAGTTVGGLAESSSGERSVDGKHL